MECLSPSSVLVRVVTVKGAFSVAGRGLKGVGIYVYI